MEAKLKKLLLWGVYALPLVVFVNVGVLPFAALSEKSFVFRILIEVLVGIWLIVMLRDSSYRPKVTWILLVLMDFLLIVGVANYFGENPTLSMWSNLERMEGFITLLHFFGYFILLVTVLQTKQQWVRFLKISLGSSFIVAGIALLQAFGVLEGVGRVASVLGNASYLAVYLLLHIFIAVFLWVWAPCTRARVVTALVVLVAALVATGSRGALLGLVGAATLASAIIALVPHVALSQRKIAGGVLALCILVPAILFGLKDTNMVSESPLLSRVTNVSLTEGTAEDRLLVWQLAFTGAREHRMLGWGQENFEVVYNKYYDPRLATAEEWFDRTHNIFLEWLIAAGSIGVAFFAGIFIFAFIVLWRRIQEISVTQKAVLTGALSAYLVQGMFTSDTFVSYLLLFTLLAFIHHLGAVPLRQFLMLEESERGPWVSSGRIVPALVGVLTLVVAFSVNYQPLVASLELARASAQAKAAPEQALLHFDNALRSDTWVTGEVREELVFRAAYMNPDPTIASTTKRAYQERAFQEIDAQIAGSPGLARYPLHAAFLAARSGNVEKSLEYLDQAKSIAPKKEKVYVEEGILLYNYGRYEEADAAFAQAWELAPDDMDIGRKYVNAGSRTLDFDEFSARVYGVFGTLTPAEEFLIPIYEEQGRYEAIIAIYDALYEKDSSNLQYLISKAATLTAIWRRSEAIEVLEEVKRIDPSTAEEIDDYILQLRQGM